MDCQFCKKLIIIRDHSYVNENDITAHAFCLTEKLKKIIKIIKKNSVRNSILLMEKSDMRKALRDISKELKINIQL